MKEKVLSFVLWVALTAISIYSYWYFTSANNSNTNFTKWAFQTWEMTDEQIKSMADRVWISADDLKKELDSWKTIREIMKEKWASLGWWNRTWTIQDN